eukprot:6203658-Pleurochrysis_carterae.AAC.1
MQQKGGMGGTVVALQKHGAQVKKLVAQHFSQLLLIERMSYAEGDLPSLLIDYLQTRKLL